MDAGRSTSAQLRDAGLRAIFCGDLDRADLALVRLETPEGEPQDYRLLAQAFREAGR